MKLGSVACALLSVSLGAIVWAADGREQAATETASAWLTLIDQAKYAEAWQGLAKDRQSIWTQDSYTRTMASMAKSRGRVTSRSVRSAADDGRRVVVEFAVFQNKSGTTTETVTLIQEPDGSWKITDHVLHQRSSGVTTRR